MARLATSGDGARYCEAMSRQNVEIVGRIFEAFGRGDVEGALTYADPDIVWNPAEEAPTHGRDAARASIERWGSAWEVLKAIPEEFIDAGDRVVVTVHFWGRGRGSGIEVDARGYEVSTLRDGRVVRMDEFAERSGALEAAGLRE